MTGYCFPSNTTRDAMIRGKKLWYLDDAFWYAYCGEGFIKDICEGLLVKAPHGAFPTRPVQRKPKIGTRHNGSNKKPPPPRTVCVSNPEWRAVIEAKIIQKVREMLEKMLFAKYMESKFRVKRIVGKTSKSMGN